MANIFLWNTLKNTFREKKDTLHLYTFATCSAVLCPFNRTGEVFWISSTGLNNFPPIFFYLLLGSIKCQLLLFKSLVQLKWKGPQKGKNYVLLLNLGHVSCCSRMTENLHRVGEVFCRSWLLRRWRRRQIFFRYVTKYPHGK